MDIGEVNGEFDAGSAYVRVQTYHYDAPEQRIHVPGRHTLILLTSRRPTSRYLVARPGSPRHFSMGDLMYIPPGQTLLGNGHGAIETVVTCALDESATDAFKQFQLDWADDAMLAQCADIRSTRLVEAMRRLGEEAVRPGFGSDILVDAVARTLPVEFIRHFENQIDNLATAKGGLTPRQLKAVEDYVRAWPETGVKIQHLAELAGLSAGHFARAFKQSTGKTVHTYVEEVRVARAKQLLRDQNVPLKQIAALLGFGTPSSFSLAFRRATGGTPRQYRLLNRDR